MPEDPGGQPKWVALEEAVISGRREADHLIRYDVQDPRTGVFGERYFTTRVQPIRGIGNEIEVYEVSILEITPIIAAYQALQAEQM